MFRSELEQKNQITSINRYNNFGLREKDQYLWISTLIDMKDAFFPWNETHPLGKKMVEAASAWFQQSELIDSKTRKPTNLVDLFEKIGTESSLGWEFIWTALANNAMLIKWYVTATAVGEEYTIEKLADMLKTDYPSLNNSTINGGLSALKDMVSKSPLGDDDSMISYTAKGRKILSVTRLSKNVHPLTVLYGLYLIARLSDRSTFTVTGLLEADIDSAFVSPVVAFNLPSSEFKKICEGLHSRYPDYISTTFTHGNDEIRVFPDRFNTTDVIELAIKEG